MNKYFLYILAGTMSLFSCERTMEPFPSLNIIDESIEAPGDGGLCRIQYHLENPVVDGAIVYEAEDWMYDFDISSEGTVSFTASANISASQRSGVVTVGYVYGGGECSDSITVTQPGSVNSDWILDADNLTGQYYGQRIMSAGHRYVVSITENTPVDGRPVDGMNYSLAILSLAPVDNVSFAPMAEIYTVGNTSDPGTLSIEESYFTYVEDGNSETLFFTEGRLLIEDFGSGYRYTAELTDTEGKTHYVRYEGPVVLSDESENAPLSTLSGDYEADLRGNYCNAYYRGDYQGNGTSLWLVTITPRGLSGDALQFDLYAPASSDLETGIPLGRYEITEDCSENTIMAGYRDYGLMGAWWYTNEYGGTGDRMAPLRSGILTVSIDEDDEYRITLNAEDDRSPANTITAEWTGEINFEKY